MRSLSTSLIFFFLIFSQGLFCQNFSKEDSLKAILNEDPPLEQEIEVLREILHIERSSDSLIKYSSLLIERGEEASNDTVLQKAHYSRGVSWRRLSEYDKALKDLFKSAQLAEELEQLLDAGNIYTEIGNLYSESGNNKMAAIYYDRGINIIRKSGDKYQLGRCLYNVGDHLFEQRQLDSSLVYTLEALDIFKEFNDTIGKAYAIGNLGRLYLATGELENVEAYLEQAIEVLERVEDYNALTDFYSAMAKFYRKKEELPRAIFYAQKGLEAAGQDNMKTDQAGTHLLLSRLFEEVGDVRSSFDHYKMYVKFKDSITNVSTVQEMANLRSSFEIAKKQKEVDLLNQRTRNQKTIVVATIVALVLIVLLAFGLYRRNKFIGRTKKIIEFEKNRSELLLLNILPQETANELKEKGKVEAKRFDAVTILFTDFQNFTHYAENLPPEELVKSVDFYFTEFDRIVEKFGLEKIKTVGDSYMCAAGVPFPAEDHATRIVAAACEMMAFVKDARQLESLQETRFEVRIGINSGPVVAGVVGSKKFAYDIWGDAVNIASRMESSGETGHINISEGTYELVKHEFDCVFRGDVNVKNKGMMKMYYVNCPATSSSL